MENELGLRYQGARWVVRYGTDMGIERFALIELQRMVQRFVPYVLDTRNAAARGEDEGNRILVGTRSNNPQIARLVDQGQLAPPPGPHGYSLACLGKPGKEGRTLAVVGDDPAGVLHGVEDLNARILGIKVLPDDPRQLRHAFDDMDPFAFAESPAIAERGIWTWGYVIYDFRRFLDAMARLRMNVLTVWNDHVPLNARDIIAHAHSRGIRVIWGFPWGWGYRDLDLANGEHASLVREQVVKTWTDQYASLGVDGIYFQTLTEHNREEQGDKSVAALATEWVNRIAAGLFALAPDLKVDFGLHATSIREHYPDLALLDPRIRIVWEDAGTLPWAYVPASENPGSWLSSFGSTVEYAKKIATLRPDTGFAMVAKGWTTLRWDSEFEHHGPFILGERDPVFITQRLGERQPGWDLTNARWLPLSALARRFYREILACRPGMVSVIGLVEDGLLEETIQPSVSEFARTLWNPGEPAGEPL